MHNQNNNLPTFITKYFWGDDLKELNWEKHHNYIIQTLLEKGDQRAYKWLLSKENPQSIHSLLSQLKLSKKSANFWSIYLS